ncbi:unnamed protein product [Paramecium primaurelia]|uniref:WD-40 repeat protein n=1 Tax=Paramecium primaurelia TaxID=5886 RepID=A0A8S1QSH3_PARPR|nr:unnamed protein product [Paramecium primaurelia]
MEIHQLLVVVIVLSVYGMSKQDGHTHCVWSVCFSPDGNTLASSSRDNSIRLWDVKTGQQQAIIESHSNQVWSVCFSPDGNILAFGSGDKSIRLWDVKNEQEIQSDYNKYKDILAQFKIPFQQNTPISEGYIYNFYILVSNFITTLVISQKAIFQAKGALILKGEFITKSGIDLKTLFKQKGSYYLEDQSKK